MTAYEVAARAARKALYAEAPPSRETLKALSRTALALAPDDEHERQWRRILDALADGHRFKVATFPATFTAGDEDVELIADLETAFDDFKEEQ